MRVTLVGFDDNFFNKSITIEAAETSIYLLNGTLIC